MQKIKLGDDHEILELTQKEGEVKTFVSNSDSSWMNKDDEVSVEKLRQRIEPWLTSLFQSEHLNLLVGSGLSSAIQKEATGELPSGMSWINDLKILKDEVNCAAAKSAAKSGRSEGNIEDQIRVINDGIKGLELLTSIDNPRLSIVEGVEDLKSELKRCLGQFSESICNGEYQIKTSLLDKRVDAFNYLVSFLMSFASRNATRDRLHIFTTNYDRIIEMGAELAGLRLIDRFIGSVSPVFRSSRLEVDYHYNPPGIRGEPRYLEGVARFTKLHGSLDWLEHEGSIRRFGLPFGAKSVSPFLEAEGEDEKAFDHLMIYPNSVKDRETSEYPYVDLFRDLAAAVCRPNSTLVTYGYSFGDDHINRVIEDMLTVPSTHIVIIAFGDPLNRIQSFVETSGRNAQISLLMGDHLGDLTTLVDHYLPKPAIDRATIKMAELLKQRGLTQIVNPQEEVKGDDE